MTLGKVLPLEELKKVVGSLKADGKRVIHCHGVFDLLHIGHIHHFEESKALGDVLVVTVTPDQYVNKGPHRPAFPEALRAQTISSLGVVDYVAVNEWPTAEETLRLLHPDVYSKGAEYRERQVDADQNLLPEVEVTRELGIEVAFTGDGVVFSSSELLNRHLSGLSPEADAWLDDLRRRYSSEDVIRWLDSLQQKSALVVGEAIIDEYVYCSAIGKSTKDPVLACQYNDTEAYAGGSIAVANHVAGFCNEVTLVTYLGEEDRHEDFVRDSLRPNVKSVFITKSGAPTVRKRRFVEPIMQTKLLELYVMDDRPMSGADEQSLQDALRSHQKGHDLTIVADYGHGLMTPGAIETICEGGGFLAVNAQSNAGNRGFNPISRYPRADYVCLAQHEIMIETRMRDAPIRDLLKEVAQRISCSQFTVTRGKFGSLHYTAEEGFTEVPAFASKVVDRVGAGDGFLSLSSLLLSQGAPWDIIGLAGNVAGAQIVAELGNRKPLERVATSKHIISLMK
jgi:cytidyltransferase-like protein